MSVALAAEGGEEAATRPRRAALAPLSQPGTRTLYPHASCTSALRTAACSRATPRSLHPQAARPSCTPGLSCLFSRMIAPSHFAQLSRALDPAHRLAFDVIVLRSVRGRHAERCTSAAASAPAADRRWRPSSTAAAEQPIPGRAPGGRLRAAAPASAR